MKTRRNTDFHQRVNEIEGSLQNPSHLLSSCALLYQENSKLTKFSLIKSGEGISKFSNPYVLARAAQPYKCFPTKKTYDIASYLEDCPVKADLFETVKKRRSGRNYISYSISVNEIAHILHYSYGITKQMKIKDAEGVWSYRAVPSGGALYPLEIYFYLNYSALPKGVYHYRPDKNSLELIREGDCMEDLRKVLFAEPNVNLPACSCILFISSVMDRILMKYGERGYRFILQEAGFVAEHMSLVCEAFGLSSCMIGSYLDEEVNSLLSADGVFETIQSVIVVGKKEDRDEPILE